MVTPAKSWAPDRGDMIWIDFNPQAGNEMKNEHPMLVLSTKAFRSSILLIKGRNARGILLYVYTTIFSMRHIYSRMQ